ncbi:odontogenesis associated phosphoprotein [Suncus etruscus]|uniref:odontogenesis associated phosphoprotein n=1 Tax=Suncus etruscus TaxID=109475 RepID=UPI00211083BC|nr:odontogenesis associated phosphoprotein [Suncus etruscus]
MAHRFTVSWLLVYWLVGTVAEANGFQLNDSNIHLSASLYSPTPSAWTPARREPLPTGDLGSHEVIRESLKRIRPEMKRGTGKIMRLKARIRSRVHFNEGEASLYTMSKTKKVGDGPGGQEVSAAAVCSLSPSVLTQASETPFCSLTEGPPTPNLHLILFLPAFLPCEAASSASVSDTYPDLLFSPTGRGDSPPGVDPTDCQIFTLTPPPITRHPVTRSPPFIWTPKCPIHRLPPRRPGIYIPYPNSPPRCKHRFQLRPIWRPLNRFSNYRYVRTRQLQKGSSSESREKIKTPNRLKQRKRMLQKRLK